MRSILLVFLALVPGIAYSAYVPAYTIVADKQRYEVELDGSYNEIYERRIRIETPQGIEQFGQGRISYDGKRDSLEIVEAYTVRANGEKVIVSPDRIKRISANTDDVAPYFSDQMLAIIIFPQVEVGSELHYKVIRQHRTPIFKGRFSDITPYSPHRRYEDAEYILTHPSAMKMQTYTRDVHGKEELLDNGRIMHTYSFKQSEAYPMEPGEVEYEDFSPVIQISNYPDYADLARMIHELFKLKSQVTSKVQKVSDSITMGSSTPENKAQRIYDWVSKNIRYVGIDVATSGYEPHYADEILEHGYGDCKDHATLLEALLMAAGIPSSPALIKTTQSYKLPILAGNHYFDHVITYVPMFNLYLDSTAQFSQFGTLPMDDMGKPTLITANGEIGETPKSSSKRDYTITRTKLFLSRDGSITGTSEFKPHGYFITNSRAAQFSYENRDTQIVVDSILKKHLESGSGQITHGDPTDLQSEWIVKSDFKLDPLINLPGLSAFSIPTGLAPGFIKLHATIKNYNGRRYPYGCGSSKHTERVEIVFPPSVNVRKIPKNREITIGNDSYKSSYTLNGKTLIVSRSWVGDQKADVCMPSASEIEATRLMRDKVKQDLRGQIFVAE